MKPIMGKKRRILAFIIFISLSFSQTAHASFLSNVSSGLNDLINIANRNALITKVRNDFCSHYASADISNTDVRINFWTSICSEYTKSTVASQIATTSAVSNIKTVPKVTKKDTVQKSTQSSVPEIVTNTTVSTNGDILDSNQILYWTNIERSKNDTTLVALNRNSFLDTIAVLRTDDMFAKNYFDHVSPTGDTVSKIAPRVGYEYITIGENIALGNYASSRDLVQAWMASPGHRVNILSKNYTQIGIAAREGLYNGQKVWIATQVFGRPVSDCKQPDASIKSKIATYTSSATDLSANLAKIKAKLNAISTSDTATYNQTLSEYNSAVHVYNDIVAKMKELVPAYNTGVQDFNNCIKTK